MLLRKYFLDEINIWISRFWVKQITLLCGWASSNQLEFLLKQRLRFPKEGIWTKDCSVETLPGFPACLACPSEFRLQTAALILPFISSLLACPVNIGLNSPHKCVSQHLKVNLCLHINLLLLLFLWRALTNTVAKKTQGDSSLFL